MARVFILRWTPADWAEERRCRALWKRIERERSWTKFIDRRGVLAHFALEPHETAPIILRNEQGAIIGPIFSAARRGSPPITQLGPEETSKLVESGRGEMLAQDYWGAYAAILHDRGRDILTVVREPTGAQALFIGQLGAAMSIFSHAADYLALADDAAPDMRFLSAFIAQSLLVTPHTALRGVRELMAGEQISIGRRKHAIASAVIWTPAPRHPTFEPKSFQEAAGGLREIVLSTAQSWANASPRIAHRLSGGLDSTIVLSALCKANAADVVALNAYPDEIPEGDERHYARAAVAPYGVRLIEVAMSPQRITYERLLDAHFGAKPSRASMSFTDDSITQAIAAALPEALVTSGQGGDQVFHRLRTPIIAADAWRDGCSLALVMEVALDTARLARRPVWDVFSAILEHGVFRRPYTWAGPMRGAGVFALEDGIAIAKRLSADHPWTKEIREASPARALRIAHVMDLQYYHQPNGLNARFTTQPVLASQPIVEHCLRVPPYVMTWGGRERALARSAFADLIPDAILKRTGKGDTTRYHAAALTRQLPFIREMLIGGELEKAGVLEARALQTALARDVISEASVSVALSSALLAEIWLRRFQQSRSRTFTGHDAPDYGESSECKGEEAKRA